MAKKKWVTLDLEEERKKINHTDLSVIKNSATHWLQENLQAINKSYKNKQQLMEVLQPLAEVKGVGQDWYNNFIKTVNNLYEKSPEKSLEYIYNCYLRGSNLSLNQK